jgi:hypothetical protein
MNVLVCKITLIDFMDISLFGCQNFTFVLTIRYNKINVTVQARPNLTTGQQREQTSMYEYT